MEVLQYVVHSPNNLPYISMSNPFFILSPHNFYIILELIPVQASSCDHRGLDNCHSRIVLVKRIFLLALCVRALLVVSVISVILPARLPCCLTSFVPFFSKTIFQKFHVLRLCLAPPPSCTVSTSAASFSQPGVYGVFSDGRSCGDAQLSQQSSPWTSRHCQPH